MRYNYQEVEKKWKAKWIESNLYKVSNNSDRPKYYVLDMFPYPSGAGLHVGHPLGYIASDIYARYKRLKGFNVLHPMGFDAFGLPAEEYAIATGVHPAESTAKNIKRYKQQLGNLGFSFDWSREVQTCDPKYYKWTQWIFSLLFSHYYDLDANSAKPINELVTKFEEKGSEGVNAFKSIENSFSASEWQAATEQEKDNILSHYRLAYRKVGYVNWCAALGTVLANDQIKEGFSERGRHPVEKKAMTQWTLRTTAYAERLLAGLEDIDWSSSLKTIQRNWIGKSNGAQLFFPIEGSDSKLEIFTTRADTIFGATFMVIAPEHPLVNEVMSEAEKHKVEAYLKYVKTRSDRDRVADIKEVTGVFTGGHAVNPFNGKKVPIWVAEYVLMDYGTGAIMAVPSDDERDYAFATKFGLEITEVIDKSAYPNASKSDKVGRMINSDFLNSLEVPEAIERMGKEVVERNIGSVKTNYKMRDAGFSRQRYWGEPFPVTYQDGVAHVAATESLPVELPHTDDFKPTADGKSPLSRIEDWVSLSNGGVRETDTMPAVAGSSWYFLRYMDPNNEEAFAGKAALDYWNSVDLYVGGAEHAVAHLLYARFWHKFLYDLDYVPSREPFKKLVNQGMIQGQSMLLTRFSFNVIEMNEDGFKTKNRTYESGFGNEIVYYGVFDLDFEVMNPNSNIEKIDHGFLLIDGKNYKINGDLEQMWWHVPIDKCTDDGFIEYSELKKLVDNNRLVVGESLDDKSFVYSYKNGVKYLKLQPLVEKMSKSKYNVVNPDIVVAEHGADTFRLYEMFLGPIEQSKPWDTQGIEGVSKFVKRLWSLYFQDDQFSISDEEPTKDEYKILHQTIKKVNEDIEKFSFNTAISAMMICVNELKKSGTDKRKILEPLLLLIAPFAPFASEELWALMGNAYSIHQQSFPEHDESYLVQDAFEYPICVNGKKRSLKSYPADTSKEEMEKDAVEIDEIKKWLDGKNVVKVIVVPKRMINIVVK